MRPILSTPTTLTVISSPDLTTSSTLATRPSANSLIWTSPSLPGRISTIAPVLASFAFRKETREWENPVLVWVIKGYRHAVTWVVHHRWAMVAVSIAAVCCSAWLLQGERIGSEFLPHLDEGALWVRGTLAPSTGPT